MRPRTIICDIDGVLLKHHGDITKQHLIEPVVLPGVIEKIREWDLEGCSLVLLTGRRESVRPHTERQLARMGIIYDHLIMGVTGGTRELINDCKPDGSVTTKATSLERNAGFETKKARPTETIKPWGSEDILEANERYVLKKIVMKARKRCSLQKHERKRETIYLLSGLIRLVLAENARTMFPGDSETIPANTVHRMAADVESIYLEVSTPELDDVVRLEDDYGRVE